VQEPTSSREDSDNDESENSHYSHLFKVIPSSTNDLKNPFIMNEPSPCSSINKETPQFIRRPHSNVFSFKKFIRRKRKDTVDYNEPSRYLYEFFAHKKFPKFKKAYEKFANDTKMKSQAKLPQKSIKVFNQDKMNVFIEILNTLILLKPVKDDSLLEL
jgi:hypothetical protein